jgi:hypothetical protein
MKRRCRYISEPDTEFLKMSSTSSKRIVDHSVPITGAGRFNISSAITLSVMGWVIFEIPWILATYATLERVAAMLVAKSAFCLIAVLYMKGSHIARALFFFICFVSSASIILQFPTVYQDSYLFAALFSVEALLKLTACAIIFMKYKGIPAYKQ